MTIEQRKKWYEGKSLWFEYIKLNDYAIKPNKDGLRILSKKLKLSSAYIEEKIYFYLEN